MIMHKLILISFIPALVSDDTASFLLIGFLVEFSNLLLTGILNPFVEAELDQLNRNSLIIVCLVLFYGIAIQVKPNAAGDPWDSQIQVRLQSTLLYTHIFSCFLRCRGFCFLS